MSLKGSVIANYLGQGWSALMGIAFVPLYVRALGVESYGLVGVFTVLQAWLTLLDFGLTPTLNREMARLRAGVHTSESIRDLLRSLEIIYSGLAILMVGAVYLLAPWMASIWLKSSNLPQTVIEESIRIMGFVLAARWIEQVYRGALQGMQDQVWLNIIQAGFSTLRWAGAYTVVTFISPTILLFFVWQGLVSLLTVSFLVHRTYAVLPKADRHGRFDKMVLRNVQRFAAGMFLSAILTFALTQADKIVISKLLPLDQLGYYMLATTASGGLIQLIMPMNNAIYPRLTEQVTNGDQIGLAQTYHQACEWMSAIIIPPSLLLTFFAGPVLLAWTGDLNLVHSVKGLLALLTLGTLCNGLMNLPYMLQLAYGWTSLTVYTNAIAVLLIVPTILWAVPRYGSMGAAGAWFVLNLSYLILTAHLIYRKLLPQSKWRWYRETILLPLGVGSLVSICLHFVLPAFVSRSGAIAIVILATLTLFIAVIAVLPNVRSTLTRTLSAVPSRIWKPIQ